MIEEGKYLATILSHSIQMSQSGKMFVELRLQIDEDTTTAKIWMTHAATNMAKLQLRACGFDIHTQNLQDLENNHEFLKGKKVPVSIDENEYNGKVSLQCNIDGTPPVVKSDIEKMQEAMRKSKPKEKKARPVTDDDPVTDEDIPF